MLAPPNSVSMAHGLNSVIRRGGAPAQCRPEGKTGVGSRRIFSPQFKLQVLDSYRNDADCKGNQRATARKYGIHRRQIQKWLQVENTLRSGVGGGKQQQPPQAKSEVALNGHRQRDDESSASAAAEPPRVPALEPPTSWRAKPPSAPLPEATAPMDLSLKRAPAPWDLSLKRRAEEDVNTKPVKLFKPYLDDLKDRTSPPKMSPASPHSLYCCQPPLTCSPELFYINNNNNLYCDVKSPEYHPAYTLHELQPNTAFYPYPPYYPDYHPELSPPYCPYEEPHKLQPAYSLDFKLSAIDCHSRALPKYNSPSQRWIKNEDDSSSASETLKQTHAVR